MNEAPKRAVQFKLEIQGDTPFDIATALLNLSVRIERDQLSSHGVSGGVNTGYEYWFTASDHPTHEEYVERLNEYLRSTR
ncbi:hypothetical protein [Burkholderia vietnamiensis]|uniref:hypothetical protein n=1 Tax=Burkholderia vietnamiensis TaxID=60552 RepID=UPI001CF546BB|nr:hypothetical protein [Burkholderia vietnamiensis]MCA8195429.1 hypothetical protein [Burkholderia vietnamiensis]